MDAISTPLPNWAKKLSTAYPQFSFTPGDRCVWRPSERTVYYAPVEDITDLYDLFHELGHATLGHQQYSLDVSLIRLEAAAWQEATQLAAGFNLTLPEDHQEQAMETYRQWLTERSTCPQCSSTGLQTQKNTYRCINCRCSWRVPLSRTCITRRYRTVLESEE